VFFFLRGNFSAGAIYLDVEEEGRDEAVQVLFDSLENEQTLRVDTANPEQPVAALDIRVSGVILEYNGENDLTMKAHQSQLEEQISASIESMAEDIIRQIQEHKADALGIGKKVRNQLPYLEWEKLDWREVYAGMDITVNVETEIVDIGFYR
jgi:spore germination protein